MTNRSRCKNCNDLTEFYSLYARIPIPKTKKNKWVRLSGFRICSKCQAITLGTDLYKEMVRIQDGTFSLLDKLVIVPKSREELDKDIETCDKILKELRIG